jgi:hypothetical protein
MIIIIIYYVYTHGRLQTTPGASDCADAAAGVSQPKTDFVKAASFSTRRPQPGCRAATAFFKRLFQLDFRFCARRYTPQCARVKRFFHARYLRGLKIPAQGV